MPSRRTTALEQSPLRRSEARLEMLAEFRRRRRSVHKVRRAVELLDDVLDHLEELAGEAEARLAAELLRGGPLEVDQRRYEHETRDGCDCVRVSPVDPQ